MAKTKSTNKLTMPTNVVERNLALTGDLMRYLLERPQIFNALPDNFELVILPDDDPEIRLYNLDLLDTYGSKDKPIVFARIKSGMKSPTKGSTLSLYAPVAA